MIKFIIGIIFFLCVLKYVLSNGEKDPERFLLWVIVPPGYEYIRLRFGDTYKRSIMRPGYNLMIPFIHTIGGRVNVKLQTKKLPTHDYWYTNEVEARLNNTIYYKVIDPVKRMFSIESLEETIETKCEFFAQKGLSMIENPNTNDTRKAQLQADDAFRTLLPEINEFFKEYGIEVIRLACIDFNFKDILEEGKQKIALAEQEREVILVNADANAAAQKKIMEVYKRFFQEMRELGASNYEIEKIMKNLIIQGAIDKGNVKTMIIPNGSNTDTDTTSFVASAVSVADELKE